MIGANNLTDADKKLPAITVELSNSGTYSICSEADIYIYYVSVTEGTAAEVSFDDGEKPSVTGVARNAEDATRLDVTVSGTIPDPDTDRLWVKMYDAKGVLVDSEKISELTTGSATVTLTPNGRGTYTFVCEAIRAGAERTYVSTPMTCAAFWERGFVGLEDSAGTIEIDSTAEKITMTAGNGSGNSGGRLADSDDSFLYYYTEIDPTKENFTLTGTFTVKEAPEDIKQSGFGVMAVDTFVNKISEHRYFNSAGCMVRKYIQTVNGAPVNKYGIPGGYFVTGYTGASNASSSNRKTIDTAPLNWNAPSFDTGSVYTLTLKKDNTGFHAIMDVAGDNDPEVLCYEPELLLQQDTDRYYVGFAVARKIKVEISDIQFTTSNPATDPDRIHRPATPVTPTCAFTTASTSPSANYTAGFTADYKGTLAVYDSNNALVKKDIAVDPTSSIIATADLTLAKGENKFYAVFTPSNDAEQGDLLGENETIDPEQTITKCFTVSFRQYGTSDNCIYVSTSGSSTGTGSKNSPLDIYTAVAYAQPGQEIVLAGGTYNLTEPLDIERGHNGTAASLITIMSDPESDEKVILDGTNCAGDMIKLSGDYWHLYDLKVENAKNNFKGLQISGNHNIVEKLTVSGCGSTGIQISGKATEPSSLWPANNLVLSCESYNNCDPQKNDADGFAAKLTVGDGNIFRYCIAHHNINDGWDLYARANPGAIGEVTIDQCVAYENGKVTYDPTAAGEGNGFKLGGENISVAHMLANSIAYNNLNNGVFSNTNPVCQIANVTSYANGGHNLKLNTNAATTAWRLERFISYGTAGVADSIGLKGQLSLESTTNYLDGTNSELETVAPGWFESLDTSIAPTIAPDGSIDMHGLLVLTSSAPDGVGAVIGENPNPTVIEIGSEIKDQKSVTDTAKTNITNTSTETTINSDGSTTTTETVRKPDGSTQITKTTQELDGSKEQSVVTEGKQSDGSTVKSETSVKTDSEGKTTASAAVTSDSENGYATIPAAVLERLSKSDEAELTIETPNGNITLSGDAIRALANKGSTAPTVQITPVDSDKLPSNVRQAAEGMQVFSLTVDGAGIDFGGEVEIGLPYARKTPHTVISIYYVASNGERTLMAGSGLKNGMARFRTTHLSYYAIEEAVMPFADVNVDDYYARSVLWAVNNSITTGNTATAFSPDEACTRAQAVTFLWRASGSPEPSITENPFTDVAADAYYYKAVLWAVEKGITNGDTATTFAPDKTCTRAQIVTFQWRAAGKPVTDYAMSMSDVGEGAYYAEAVRWALSEQITNGETETTFAPDADCTRAQIVTFLYRRLG